MTVDPFFYSYLIVINTKIIYERKKAMNLTDADKQKYWKTVSSHVAYPHPFLTVREDVVLLPNGHRIEDFAIWENNDVAQVLAITPEKKLILARQYKHGAGKMVAECPGGFIDDGEEPEMAARRELEEEVGLTAPKFKLLATFIHHATKETSTAYFYLALNATELYTGKKPEITEDIEVLQLSLSEVFSMIEKGDLQQTGTIAGIMLAVKELGEDFFSTNDL